ncbi:MAG: hypothetical protein QM734_11705 [Cyclobacteriaceae bacterium]
MRLNLLLAALFVSMALSDSDFRQLVDINEINNIEDIDVEKIESNEIFNAHIIQTDKGHLDNSDSCLIPATTYLENSLHQILSGTDSKVAVCSDA